MTSFLRALCVLSAPLLIHSGRAELDFVPVAGEELEIERQFSMELELTDLQVSLDGEELDMSGLPMPEVEISFEGSMRILDLFVEVEAGRPTLVHRTYEQLGSERVQTTTVGSKDAQSEVTIEESELEGATVAFRWDEDDEVFEASFDGEDSEDLDEGLLEELALRGYLYDLLPEGEVEEGESWEVDASTLAEVVKPCGDVQFAPADGSEADARSLSDPWNDMEGEFRVTYGGTRDEDGTTVAVLSLEVDAEGEVEEDAVDDGESETSAKGTVQLELEGELLWSLEQNRPFTLSLEGDLVMEFEDVGPGQGALSGSTQTTALRFEGSFESTASYN